MPPPRTHLNKKIQHRLRQRHDHRHKPHYQHPTPAGLAGNGIVLGKVDETKSGLDKVHQTLGRRETILLSERVSAVDVVYRGVEVVTLPEVGKGVRGEGEWAEEDICCVLGARCGELVVKWSRDGKGEGGRGGRGGYINHHQAREKDPDGDGLGGVVGCGHGESL